MISARPEPKDKLAARMPCCCKLRLKARFQEWLIVMLERRYTGIREVVGLLDKIRERVENQEIKGLQDDDDTKTDNKAFLKEKESGDTLEIANNEAALQDIKLEDTGEVASIFKPEDGKWRPVVATLGLIYKLQKVSDDSWYDNTTIIMKDLEKATTLVDLMGHYWKRMMDVAANIKGEEEEELRENLAKGMELKLEEVVYVFNKDAEKADIEDHCPDIAVNLDHERKELVLTVCGTKMFPIPSPADIIMDLYANCVPFHNGRAHRGMAAACENILEKVMDLLVAKLTEFKDHKLMVVGYSLGAGVAQLLALKLTEGPENGRLPEGTRVQCITFGSPPVYAASEPGYVNPAIVSVYNHNDGLASLSLHSVTRLFLQIRAINRLCLPRRQTLRLLRSTLGQMRSEGGTRRFLAVAPEERADGWGSVTAAIEAVQATGFTSLTHCAGVTYLMKRVDHRSVVSRVGKLVGKVCCCRADSLGVEKKHVVRRLEGKEAEPLARELRLRAGMFNDHMPWGYAGLFKDCGGCEIELSLDMLKYI